MKALLISLQRNLNIIGLRSVHHFLIEKGHASDFIYLNRFDEKNHAAMEAFRAFVGDRSPGVIGISVMAVDYQSAVSLTTLLKTWFPNIPVVWGGIHPTVAPEMCVDHADYVCLGEGEDVMLDIANAIENKLPLRAIDNLCYRENGELRMNPIRALQKDLDAFPILTQISPNSFIQSAVAVEPLTIGHLKKFKLFRGSIYQTMISRGCPMRCSYCVNSFMKKLYCPDDWAMRRRSVEHVMRELELAVKEGPKTNYIVFRDDCLLGGDLPYLKDFFAQYKTRIGLPFLAKCTSNVVTPERLNMVMEAGLAFLGVGLQSGSDRVCREVYKRPLMPDDFLRAARLINQFPMAASYDIIVDNPFETPEEEIATIETVAAIPKPFILNMFPLTFFRGTDLRQRVEQECPHNLHEPEGKREVFYRNSNANRLKRIAATLHAPLMRILLSRYRRKPDGWLTRTVINLAGIYCLFIPEPISYFRLLRLSQRASTWKAIKMLFALLDFNRLIRLPVLLRPRDAAEE